MITPLMDRERGTGIDKVIFARSTVAYMMPKIKSLFERGIFSYFLFFFSKMLLEVVLEKSLSRSLLD